MATATVCNCNIIILLKTEGNKYLVQDAEKSVRQFSTDILLSPTYGKASIRENSI